MLAIAAGEPVVDVIGENGKPTGDKVPAPIGVQVKAAEHVGKCAELRGLIGARLEVEHKQDRPLVVIHEVIRHK